MQYECCTRRPRSFRVAVAAIVCLIIAVAASSGIVPAYASTPSLGWLDSHYVDTGDASSSENDSDNGQETGDGSAECEGSQTETPSGNSSPATVYDEGGSSAAERPGGESSTTARTDPSSDSADSPDPANSADTAKPSNRLGPLILITDAEAVAAAQQQAARDTASETWRAKKDAAALEREPAWDQVFTNALVASSVIGALAFAIAGSLLVRSSRANHPSGNRRRAKAQSPTKRR
ncbi:DUF4179 domain-containing protein [Raoultibacter phocaeensis]|uniref:DUF4179 domain-containing protein n=1 Tax=Raoultibacter phocaeensis TaxID=2479841 RepID=UPI001119AC33|nr:DUF4179 domain-containing protein [Raoultibacter phocaeensis]